MKTHPATFHSRIAFTLIELITVIAIIAILMSLLFPVIAAGREAARRNKASVAAKAIVNACKNYANDYGKHPPIPAALVNAASGGSGREDDAKDPYYSYGDTAVAKCKVPNNQLFDVLRAIARGPNQGDQLNKRKQSYFEDLTAKDAKNPQEGFADGKGFPDELQGQLFDPWGKQYCIVLDANDDGLLKLDDFFRDLTEPLRHPAVAFAMARNQEIGGKGYQGRLWKEGSSEAPEDIISW